MGSWDAITIFQPSADSTCWNRELGHNTVELVAAVAFVEGPSMFSPNVVSPAAVLAATCPVVFSLIIVISLQSLSRSHSPRRSQLLSTSPRPPGKDWEFFFLAKLIALINRTTSF